MIMALERSTSRPAKRVHKLLARVRRRQLDLARDGHVVESARYADRARRLLGLMAHC